MTMQASHAIEFTAVEAVRVRYTIGRATIGLLLLIGLASRAAPLLDQHGRLLKQFPTEDGYLMLTIARNLALGLGMSTAAGTLPTNGTQPLTTFVWAGCFAAAGGDRALGVAFVLIVQIAIGAAAAYVLYRLGAQLLAEYPRGQSIAALAAAAWFVHPLTTKHTQNCLETGAYTLLVLLCVQLVVSRSVLARWSWAGCIGLGALLGLTFWARNDAAFLILAVCLVRAVSGRRAGLMPRRIGEAFCVGAVSVIVALPWLIHNQLRFGSLMPISGQAESAHVAFARNLHRIPVALSEHLLLLLPIPNSLEQHRGVVAAGTLITLIVIVVVWQVIRRASGPLRTCAIIVSLYGVCLGLFYGLFFGAGHFVDRYLFPLSPFLAWLWATAVLWLWEQAQCRFGRWAKIAGPVCLVLLSAALHVRLFAQGDRHLHFGVVEWVNRNVPDYVWCGAIQSGTLGFFHDRTINLDGKVNPEALRARLRDEIPKYLIEKNIAYIVDWAQVAALIDRPVIAENFDLIVKDPGRNLMVLKRR